ncbi:hypothetical protein KR054_009787, partial [Drosophila jambulina]
IEFMQEFQTLGHMSSVKMPELNAQHFYIPHHCVLEPTSTSAKLRVVFDASYQTTGQKSLNDLLMVGPTIQPDLYVLLLHFRTYRYVSTFYVDDFLCGADTVDGHARIKAEVSEILSNGGFELAKWHSNHTKFVDDRTIKDLNLE